MTLKKHIKTNSSVKKVSKNHNWLKSYGILKLPFVSKISNRMAGHSKLRSMYLLNRLCFFDNFFTLEFVLMCSFKITDYLCHTLVTLPLPL